MDQQIRNRNRQHLAKALTAGLALSGRNGMYRISSEAEPDRRPYHVDRLYSGVWTCDCQWSRRLFSQGYDPRSNAIPCKHILLAIAHELPAAKQDALLAADAILRAAAEAGAARRAARAPQPAHDVQAAALEAIQALYNR